MFRVKWLIATLLLFNFVVVGSVNAEGNIVFSDIVAIDRIGETNSFFVGGYRGFLGKVNISEGKATYVKISAPLTFDALTIKSLSNNEAIIGTSRGEIYRLKDQQLTLIKLLSEFNDPIMDMAVRGDEIWVVAPRGVIAHSQDRGNSWELVKIEYVQKKVSLKSNEATTWYLGAFNIDLDSLVFNATVTKKKVVDDVDYYFNADAGNIEIVNALDESSDLSMSFNYRPGPQYQAGDVSLNTVSFIGDTILIAGEFGTVIVLEEDGKWASIYEDVRLDDSSMPYWIESTVVGQSIALVGAGGVVTVSHDRGKTWVKQDMKGDNGLLDVAFINNKDLMVAGSVGTVAINHANTWKIANRTRLGLIAWLKTIVSMGGDDKYIVAGGRGTLVSYQNKTWNKITIREAVQ